MAPVTGEKRTAGVFGPGSLIGEMALWEGGTRSADVIATGGGVSGAGGSNKASSSSSAASPLGLTSKMSSSSSSAAATTEDDDPGETLVAQFHFDEFVEFFLRWPPVAMKLFQVFVQASTSKLKEWRLRTMIAHRAMSQGAGAGAFVGVGGGGTGTGTETDGDGGGGENSSTNGANTSSSSTDRAQARENRPVLVHSIPSKKVLELLRGAHGGDEVRRMGRRRLLSSCSNHSFIPLNMRLFISYI